MRNEIKNPLGVYDILHAKLEIKQKCMSQKPTMGLGLMESQILLVTV